MKIFLMFSIVLCLFSCGKKKYKPRDGRDGRDGTSCTTTQLSNGAKISCTDGAFSIIYNGTNGNDGSNGIDGLDGTNGSDGQDGVDGTNGQNGSSCSASSTPNGARIICTNGDIVDLYNGTNGSNGNNGQHGNNGNNGSNGVGCTLDQLGNGIRVTCGHQVGYIYNGEDGEVSAYSVVELIDPCGDGNGFDEVILRMQNGELLAHYAGGNNLQFLTLLTPGNYRTTDSQACNFTVHNNLSITW